MKNNSGAKIDRLLRAAVRAPNESIAMPFGFDTRVLSHWRAAADNDSLALLRLLRRVVLMSLGVIVLASAGAYRELSQEDDPAELFSEEDGIADSAIGGALDQ